MNARFVEMRGDINALGTRVDALAGQIKFGATVFAATMAVVVGLIAVLHAGEPAAPSQVTTAPTPVVVYAVPWPNGDPSALGGLPGTVPSEPATEESPR